MHGILAESINIARYALSVIFQNRFAKIAFILFFLLYIVSEVALYSPRTMISLKAETESLDFITTNSQASTLWFEKIFDKIENICLENLAVIVSNGTKINYSRQHREKLTVSIDGQMAITSGQDQTGKRTEFVRLVADPLHKTCPVDGIIRLPIGGLLTVGTDLSFPSQQGEASLLLLSGEVSVFGRATSSIFGVIPLNWGPFEQDALYFVQKLDLPAGSKIQGVGITASNESRWWGYSDVDLRGESKSINLNATTNAHALEVYTPAPYWASTAKDAPSRPDVVALSMSARLSGDPNMLWLYGLVVLLSTIFGGIGAMLPLADSGKFGSHSDKRKEV